MKKITRKVIATVLAITLVLSSVVIPNTTAKAAIPAGYTALDTEGWHALGEDVKYTIGTGNDPVSEWSLYSGNSWSGVVAGVKDGADGQDTVSVYVDNGANDQWGLQLGKVFDGLEANTAYAYQIDYTLNGTASKWFGVETSDANGQIKIVKPLGTLVGTGKTLIVTGTSVSDPEENENTKYMAWVNTDRNLAKGKTATVSSFKEGSTDYKVLTDGVCMSWGSYVGGFTPGYFEVDLGQEYAASSIDQVVVWFRNGDASLYPANGFTVQFGSVIFSDAAKLTTYPTGGSTTQNDGYQFMVPVVIDKEKVEGNVRKVRIQVDQNVNWGTQISEIAVFSENPQGPVEVPEADNAASVAVSSTPSTDITGNIKFNITAGENQDGYKYVVFVDDEESAAMTDCVAGKNYTINGVAAGTHTIKVVSVYQGGISTGLVSEEVNVSTKLDGYVKLATEGWHPLGESRDYLIGDDNQPASEWNIYTGTGWAGTIAHAKDGADGQNTMSLYVEKKPSQPWGLQLGKVFVGLEPGAECSYKINYTNDGVAGHWEGLVTADAAGTAKLVKDLSNVISEGKFFTITDVIVKAPATNAASVAVSTEKSDELTGNITFNITAGENQDGYKYDVYLDAETTAAKTGCSAGVDYTIDGVASGKHKIKVVSTYDGSISSGITSEEVEVKTIIDDISDFAKNFAFGDDWELMGGSSTEGNGSITDGIVANDNYSTPTKGTAGSYFIVDLGVECNVADIDKILTFYREDTGGCYPENGGMLIEYSNDKETWTKAVTISQTDFNAQKAAQKGEPFGIVADVSGNTEGTVRYVKVSCPNSIAYGMQLTEIAILGEVPEDQIPVPPVTPTGLVNAPGETEAEQYIFTWEASEGANSYNVYVNNELVGTTQTNTYDAYEYFITHKAGKYTVSVSSVNKAELESEKTSIDFESVALTPVVSEDGNYMTEEDWILYIGDWGWTNGTLTQEAGSIFGDFVATGGNWAGGEWCVQATSPYVIVKSGEKYTYSADIVATKNMVMRIQINGGSIDTINLTAGTTYKYEKDVTTENLAFNVVYILGSGDTGDVTNVQFTISNHKVVEKEEVTTEAPTTQKPVEDNPTTVAPGTTQAPTTVAPETTAKVKLGKTKVKTATKKLSAKKISIKLKKVKGAKKYQIQISKKKKFTKKNILVKKTVKKIKVTVKSNKIRNKKKLWVRARAMKVVNGKKYYGKWSKVKKAKIK